jgi:hypothetical protein
MRPLALLAVVAALAVVALGVASGPAGASGPPPVDRACGEVAGTALRAHDLDCATTRRVYKLDLKSRLPKGWTCSAAIGRCAEGKLGSPRYFTWPPAA